MKYPVILVHGIVIKDFLFIKAFGKIEKTLKKEGYLVFTSKTDGFGSIENNASILKMQIEEILDKYQHVAISTGQDYKECMSKIIKDQIEPIVKHTIIKVNTTIIIAHICRIYPIFTLISIWLWI